MIGDILTDAKGALGNKLDENDDNYCVTNELTLLYGRNLELKKNCLCGAT